TKREVDLTEEWTNKIVAEAKKSNPRDYLIFRLYATKGFRRGEVLGSEARHWNKQTRKWVKGERTVPGLRIEDLEDNGIWVQGKGWRREKNAAPPEFINLSAPLVKDLREYIGKRKSGRIFEIDPSMANHLCHLYARRAGHPDWMLLHPHRLRYFGGGQVYEREEKDMRATMTFLRHKDPRSTARYIGKAPPEQRRKTSEMMETLVSV